MEDRLIITGETQFASYCRWESGGRAEVAAVFAGWIADLEGVQAAITYQSCSGSDCEIQYTMSVRQAFDSPWEFDFGGVTPAGYLAENLIGPDGRDMSLEGDELADAEAQIEALWETWAREEGKLLPPSPIAQALAGEETTDGTN